MDKQQIISFIETQVSAGKISASDLISIANGGAPVPSSALRQAAPVMASSAGEEPSRNLTHVFYGIGAIVVIIGVLVLVEQNWVAIGFAGRILVTLGLSLMTYIGAMLMGRGPNRVLAQVMFTISAVLAPLGIFVLLQEAHISMDWPVPLYVALALTAVFAVALAVTRRNILLLLTVGYASSAYYSILSRVLMTASYDFNIYKWASMLLGFSYLMIARGYATGSVPADAADAKEKVRVSNVLYGFGTLAILGAGISIGGAFDLIFIAMLFAAFYASVFFKSRAMLIFASLFLMGHIMKLTYKYFLGSIGWPVALIFVGFLVIGVGYMTFSLNRRYLRS